VSSASFVRYRSPVPDHRGRLVGVFALVNALGQSGRLSPEDETFRQTTNAWYDAAYANPAALDPTIYDRTVHPLAAAWFKGAAQHLLAPLLGHLDILDRHGVAWERVEAEDPGCVIYEDDVQVVVVPR